MIAIVISYCTLKEKAGFRKMDLIKVPGFLSCNISKETDKRRAVSSLNKEQDINIYA